MSGIVPGSPAAQYVGLRMLLSEISLQHLTGMIPTRGYRPISYLRTLEINGKVSDKRTALAAALWLGEQILAEGEVPPASFRRILRENPDRREVKRIVKRLGAGALAE